MEFQKRKIVHFRNEFVLFSLPPSVYLSIFRNTVTVICPFSEDTIARIVLNDKFIRWPARSEIRADQFKETGGEETSPFSRRSIDRFVSPLPSPPLRDTKSNDVSRLANKEEGEEGR